MKLTTIVLAGGKNLRLGRSKALETIGGQSLIERVIDRLRPITDLILIVTSGETFDLPANIKAEIISDVYDGKGSLGGIYTSLLTSRSSSNVVVACDMPFLNTVRVRYVEKDKCPKLDPQLMSFFNINYQSDLDQAIKLATENNQ